MKMRTHREQESNSPIGIAPKLRGAVLVMVALVCMVAIATGCGLQAGAGAGGVAGVLAKLQPLADDCDGPVNGYVAIDFSASGRGDHVLLDERLRALESTADQVVACGGYLKVVAFSSSAAETFTLGEETFPTSSGTENARLIQGHDAEGELLGEVNDNVAAAEHHVDSHGSDVLSQLGLAAQYQAQRGEGSLHVDLFTDGISTTKPVLMNTPEFTDTVARSSASQVDLPDLSGAQVQIAGIGRSAGKRQLLAYRIEAITDFYDLACDRARASCLVTTDYTRGG